MSERAGLRVRQPGRPRATCRARARARPGALTDAIRAYWDGHVHDLAIAVHPVGTAEFFAELEQYRFAKLTYLSGLVGLWARPGQRVLEVGCGVGIDLARFAQAGAQVTGIDLSPVAIDLARRNFALRGLSADLRVMNGEALQFADESFDVVYAHGVLQYAANPQTMIAEIHRVLRPSGEALLMAYNRRSWLNALSKLTKVDLEHADAPVLWKHTVAEFRGMLEVFARVSIVPARFPVATRLHRGWKALLYNGVFVGLFNRLPRSLIRPLGWHLLAFVVK